MDHAVDEPCLAMAKSGYSSARPRSLVNRGLEINQVSMANRGVDDIEGLEINKTPHDVMPPVLFCMDARGFKRWCAEKLSKGTLSPNQVATSASHAWWWLHGRDEWPIHLIWSKLVLCSSEPVLRSYFCEATNEP
ncbi:hypothetical protein E5D57_001882 [Metarhizium anisopliae]|nr:hypothetical protein E5D57_001882 [Metarhizium anisopliae]